ncbi:hypothetical protein BGX34_004444, partial [Mortierella sp. NVP85]
MQKTCMPLLLVISTGLLAIQGVPVVDHGVCSSSQCIQSAAAILQDMDAFSDPCTDFSMFACGGFYEREKLRHDEQKNGYLTFIERQNNEVLRFILTASNRESILSQGDLATERNLDKLQGFYAACMDQAQLLQVGRQPLQDEIRAMMDVYPGTGMRNDTDLNGDGDRKVALSTLLGYNIRNGFENPFVFELWDDETKPGYKIMTLQQSGLGLKEESFYSDEKLMKLYEKVIGEMFYIIQGNGDPALLRTNPASSIPAVWTHIAKDIITFEKILAGVTDQTGSSKISPAVEQNTSNDDIDPEYDTDSETNTITWDTIEDLNQLTPSLDWHLILNTAFPSDAIIPKNVNMLWKFYLRRMETAMQQSSPKTIQSYFVWTMIRNLGKHLAEPFIEPLKALERALSENEGSGSSGERWEYCVRMVNANLGQMAGHFFVKATFPETSQAMVVEMVGAVRWSFEKNFWQYDWLDQRTRQNALQKLKAITSKIGYSNDSPNVMSSVSIDEYYRTLNIIIGDHFGNQIRCNKWKMEGMLRSVSQPANRNKLESIPQISNAYYNPTMNAIEILAGILNPPFFQIDNPEYLNFAGIGSIAGHELGHAFDNSGRRYDENGAVRDWWTEASVQAFDVKSQCFIDQYNEFTVRGPDGTNHFVNGWGTLGENIADNGGLKMAFEAWQQRYISDRMGKRYNNHKLKGLESFSHEQLFFIQYARGLCGNATPEEEVRRLNDDNHSPRKWRINGVVQNSDHFARAFRCQPGTPMNPSN